MRDLIDRDDLIRSIEHCAGADGEMRVEELIAMISILPSMSKPQFPKKHCRDCRYFNGHKGHLPFMKHVCYCFSCDAYGTKTQAKQHPTPSWDACKAFEPKEETTEEIPF